MRVQQALGRQRLPREQASSSRARVTGAIPLRKKHGKKQYQKNTTHKGPFSREEEKGPDRPLGRTTPTAGQGQERSTGRRDHPTRTPPGDSGRQRRKA
jgi:hypothetical protein